ncbi:twin-arginine translocation signal domain-containing protein, partial [Phytoactinopolyspora endophytica]|uniref:exo-rhamnogalacturonan lyase family protein n=1 Tax=Phytoactinopolyspora endophytica TaxID=1642495 RepID=UPI00197BFAE8
MERQLSVSRRDVLRASVVTGAAAAFPSVGGIPGAAGAEVDAAASADPVELGWLGGGHPAMTPGTTWGVPWPRGAVRKNADFALSTAAGDPVPVQSWPLAYWPDGTLKWTGHAMGAGTGLDERFRIAPGRSARPDDVVTARERPGNPRRDIPPSVVVSTGVVTCRIPTSGTTLITSIERDGQDLATGGELVCVLQDGPTPRDGLGTVTTTRYTGTVDDVTIEQSGPVRAVVKVEGRYHGDDGGDLMPFTVRLYFYAGGESARVVHYFVFDGDAKADFVRGLGIRWRVPMSDAHHDRHVRFVGEDDGIWGEAVRVLSGLRRDVGGQVLQQQFDGVATNPVDTWPSSVRNGIDDIPLWSDFKLVQVSADSFHVAKRTANDSAWLLHAGHGRRAHGLGWIGGPTGGGVAFGLRDFWERHPTQLDIHDASSDEATVTVWFWSPDAPAMDLRHYSSERHGLSLIYEEPGRGIDDVAATPEGIVRSHEVMLWALPATPSRERLLELAAALREPPQLVADPEYYHSLQPFGVWSLPDRSTDTKDALETDIDRRVEFYQGQIEQRRWYGFWFHGDVMHSYDTTRHTWRYDVGGYAWDNGELAPDQALWYQFLRTGHADVFRMAEAMTLNIAETAVHHAGMFAGLGSRHNVVQWGDGAKEARISASQLKRFYYYLTADERTGDYLRSTLQVDDTMLAVPPLREALPDPSGERYIVRIGPDWTAMASNWLTEWERTGDSHYRDRIEQGLRDIAAMDLGMFTGQGGSVAFDPATGELSDVGIGQSPSNISLLFGGDQIFYEIVDLV